MTGLRGIDEYVEMELVKVNDNGKIKYFAVVPDTADNMIGVDYSYMKSEELRNIQVEYIGSVMVQKLEEPEPETQHTDVYLEGKFIGKQYVFVEEDKIRIASGIFEGMPYPGIYRPNE